MTPEEQVRELILLLVDKACEAEMSVAEFVMLLTN
jgi:hypothetical protein